VPKPEEVAEYLRRDAGRAVKVWGVEPYEFEGLLRRHLVFRACAETWTLETHVLPSGGTCGNFATDGEKIWYLGGVRKQKNLESLLRDEGVRLDRADPVKLSELLSKLLLDQRNTFYRVLPSAADIPKRGCCDLNEAERPKYEGKVKPPAVTGDGQSGWAVEFYTLSGWMHETFVLTRHVVEVSPRYEVTRRDEVLSEHVFSRSFGIVY
jgi:hypothetical protein